MRSKETGRFLRTHGMYQTRFYHIWEGMKGRCYRKTCNGYKYYGGKGIQVCEKWLYFSGFYEDMFEIYEEGLSLDRLNTSGDYNKDNCRWIPIKDQSKNKSNSVVTEIDGLQLHLCEWRNLFNLTNSMVYKRYERGELGYDLIRPSRCKIQKGSDYGLRCKILKIKEVKGEII